MSSAVEHVNSYTEADYFDHQHTGPGTLAGRYLRLYWQPVARSVDLPSGRAVPITVMSEQFTLYRGESGAVHVVAFRCAHRGTQLSTGWVEGDELRCFYHGWKYDGSGQCTEQPAEPEPFSNRIKIQSYPVMEYLGLIFAYLGEGDAPELPRYPDFEQAYQTAVYERNCNYFNTMENLEDPVHTHFVHRTRWGPGPGLWGKKEHLITVLAPEVTEWGWAAGYQRPDGDVTVHGFGMPNIWQASPRERDTGPSVDHYSLMWKVPIDDEHHLSFAVTQADGSGNQTRPSDRWRKASARAADLTGQVLSGALTVEEAEAIAQQPGEYGLAILQDSIAQVGQSAIWTRQDEHLGSSDQGLILRRKLWAQELQALAEGRPLTQWRRSAWHYVQNWNGVAEQYAQAHVRTQ
jgi:5,5'-dehydrodivanillate O-demethylase oxygenase subunit